MEKLFITTREPSSMFEPAGDLIFDPYRMKGAVELKHLIESDTKYSRAYIDGEAEIIAGFDIPVFLSGDMAQLDRELEDQEIFMILTDTVYRLLAYVEPCGFDKGYLLRLTEDKQSYCLFCGLDHAKGGCGSMETC